MDIETIPAQNGAIDDYIKAEQENFKAPSTLTKTQACADLGLTGNDAKFTSKDDAISQWEAKFSAEKAPEVAEQKWRKTSFDGGHGEIISIAWGDDDNTYSKSRELGESEADLLAHFFNHVTNLCEGRPPFFVGHYIGGFDLKFIFHRAVVLGVRPSFKLPFDGRHGQHYFCTQQAWAGFGNKCGQDKLCKILGIEGKPADISGSNVWDFVKAGDVKRVEEYNRDDVNKVRALYKKLNFISEGV